MKILPIDSIVVPENRQRRHFSPIELAELRTSITESSYGLQHPIVVRVLEGKPTLVSGERRLRAARDAAMMGLSVRHEGVALPVGHVPVSDLGELDPIDAFEAELEENIRREDLTMIEQAQATAQLMGLRQQQALRDGKPPPTTADIAREKFDLPDATTHDLGERQTTVRNQLIVARHASDPEVKKATSLKEAVKIIKKKEETARNVELAAFHGAIFKSSSHSLFNEDCLAWMGAAEAGQFNIVITDPPYGIGADEFNDSGKGVDLEAHFYDDSYETWQSLMQVFPTALARVCAVEAHAYLFCDLDRFAELRLRMSEAGWKAHRTPIVWFNPDGYRAPWPEHGPQRKYELILYARRGERKVNTLLGDVIECRKDSALGHPAQKPVALLENLLRRSARPGDKVFDPFAGSGSTIEACQNQRLACVAVEKDAGAYGIALKRLQSFRVADGGLL